MIKTILRNITPPIIWKLIKTIALRAEKRSADRSSHPYINNIDCIKLHLGCGTVYKDGWINIDNNQDNNIQKLDLNWDLLKPLPFHDNSVDFIFNEHFLEHLTVEDGISAIKDFFRVLKPGGVMRIAMPNLEETIHTYMDENWKENSKAFLEKFGLTFIQTRAERINIGFRWWGHQWLYDYEELERRLKEAGCEKIKRCPIFESEHDALKNLETRNESTLIAEVTK
jgi:predicted SAM-dependent methyltransferase